jgi:hypothetical protein
MAALAAENIKKSAFLPVFDSAAKAAGTYDTASLFLFEKSFDSHPVSVITHCRRLSFCTDSISV